MLRVTSQIPAGTWSDVPVLAGTCARIMTGAPLPPGSDAVIPFEDVAETADSIAVSHPVSPGASVRPAGNDLRAGTTVLEAGAEIVNDVSGFHWDSQMISTLADLQCGAVLMHMRGRPE